jgi:hypothetical protein
MFLWQFVATEVTELAKRVTIIAGTIVQVKVTGEAADGAFRPFKVKAVIVTKLFPVDSLILTTHDLHPLAKNISTWMPWCFNAATLITGSLGRWR